MKPLTWSALSSIVLAIACRTRQPASDTMAVTRALSSGRSQSVTRFDVGRACTRVAMLMRSRGARVLITTDTVVDSTEYNPREMACVVRADSFAVAPHADLLQLTPIDPGWSWHPFEGTGGERSYGITHDSVQCEVTPTIRAVAAEARLGFSQAAQQFHVFCYPA